MLSKTKMQAKRNNAQITGMPDQTMNATVLKKYKLPEIQRTRRIQARPLCRAYTLIDTMAEITHEIGIQ